MDGAGVRVGGWDTVAIAVKTSVRISVRVRIRVRVRGSVRVRVRVRARVSLHAIETNRVVRGTAREIGA